MLLELFYSPKINLCIKALTSSLKRKQTPKTSTVMTGQTDFLNVYCTFESLENLKDKKKTFVRRVESMFFMSSQDADK